MVLTPSNMLPLGTIAPDFDLPDTLSDNIISLQSLQSEIATVIMFICNHCPFVVHIQDKLVEVAKNYQAKGITFAAISANDVNEYPQDGPDKMKQHGQTLGFSFPYLYDETQAVAKAYDAACTPDFYIFDKELKCVYRGRFDGATPGNDTPVTGSELCDALDRLIDHKPITGEQHPSMGCNIKWK